MSLVARQAKNLIVGGGNRVITGRLDRDPIPDRTGPIFIIYMGAGRYRLVVGMAKPWTYDPLLFRCLPEKFCMVPHQSDIPLL